jgi:tRNA-Thr(GGU) m(6)t(6)A37 methyltransferase TsaA
MPRTRVGFTGAIDAGRKVFGRLPMRIAMNPIGVIHSPYKEPEGMPIQGTFKPEVEAWVELKAEYRRGLADLEDFSHAIILYYFHKSPTEQIQGRPFLEEKMHGIFSIRSPHRPNHIGLSVVKISRIAGNKLYFREVDVLDGTPVLDIKPYVKYFDVRENVVSGWVDKHFKNGLAPGRTISK